MKLTHAAPGALLILALSTMPGCSALLPAEPVIETYKSFWINANWTGGRTGSPTNSQGETPPGFVGTYCPLNSLILENHSSRYQSVFSNSRQVLVFKNTCSEPASLMVCVTYGTGGNASEFPMCDQDPRTTPFTRLAPVSMGPNNSGIQSTTWRETGLALNLNVFYCGVGDTFTLGAVSGARATDCMK